jgi:hypothetical protein
VQHRASGAGIGFVAGSDVSTGIHFVGVEDLHNGRLTALPVLMYQRSLWMETIRQAFADPGKHDEWYRRFLACWPSTTDPSYPTQMASFYLSSQDNWRLESEAMGSHSAPGFLQARYEIEKGLYARHIGKTREQRARNSGVLFDVPLDGPIPQEWIDSLGPGALMAGRGLKTSWFQLPPPSERHPALRMVLAALNWTR